MRRQEERHREEMMYRQRQDEFMRRQEEMAMRNVGGSRGYGPLACCGNADQTEGQDNMFQFLGDSFVLQTGQF